MTSNERSTRTFEATFLLSRLLTSLLYSFHFFSLYLSTPVICSLLTSPHLSSLLYPICLPVLSFDSRSSDPRSLLHSQGTSSCLEKSEKIKMKKSILFVFLFVDSIQFHWRRSFFYFSILLLFFSSFSLSFSIFLLIFFFFLFSFLLTYFLTFSFFFLSLSLSSDSLAGIHRNSN